MNDNRTQALLLAILCSLICSTSALAQTPKEPLLALADKLEAAAAAYQGTGESRAADVKRLTAEANEQLNLFQDAIGVAKEARLKLHPLDPTGRAKTLPGVLRDAASGFTEAAGLWAPDLEGADLKKFGDTWKSAFESSEKGLHRDALISDSFSVFAVLLAVLAALFWASTTGRGKAVFHRIPLLIFAYFIPTLLSNTGLIPLDSPAYSFVKRYLLPTSLVLLVLAVDIPAVLSLGRNALILFFAATISIIIGGPLAYLICQGFIPDSLGEEAWKGLATLSGSWIGGGANMVAVGESVGVAAATMGMMVVVDVALGELWTAILFIFAGRQKKMDAKIHADRTSLEEVQRRIEAYEAEVARPTKLPDLMLICAIGICTTALAIALSGVLPPIGTIIRGTTWVVLICTTVALALSFTKLRQLEGAGASKVGSVCLYLLVAVIGAHAQFSKVLDAPAMMITAAVWMAFHVTIMFIARRFLKAPIFFLAVGSKANVGGAASAPVVASAFHPALAPVGVLLAVLGYVLGTYGGVFCGYLLELVSSH